MDSIFLRNDRYSFTVLFGRAPAGLNSTGRGDLENYYNDVVGKVQRRQLKPQLEKLIKTVQLCKDGPTEEGNLKTGLLNLIHCGYQLKRGCRNK